jgi:hypothetical protein
LVLALAAVALMAGGALASPADAYVYWAASGRGDAASAGEHCGYAPCLIGTVNLDGSNPEGLVPDAESATPIAIDGSHLYWISGPNIERANLDGTGATGGGGPSFIATGGGSLAGVASDGTHVYWTEALPDAIGRANIDGTGATEHLINLSDHPQGIAVGGGHVYWAGYHAIGRANLDGTGANEHFISLSANALGVAVDGSHIYWTVNQSNGAIGRANLDGSGINESFIATTWPSGITLDGSYLYWTNGACAPEGCDVWFGAIGRANLDGGGADETWVKSAGDPGSTGGIAVDGQQANPTVTSVACSPQLVSLTLRPEGPLFTPARCTATVTDSAGRPVLFGRVYLSYKRGATVDWRQFCEVNPVAAGVASCGDYYPPYGSEFVPLGLSTVTGEYTGETAHLPSTGQGTVTIAWAQGGGTTGGTTRRCRVPRVVMKKLPVARRAITKAGCRVGKVKRKRAARRKRGRVISQSPKAGRTLARGARVNLVVGK